MNLRNVLRAYGLLRQLSDDESALLNILRALNDSDREALMLSMGDKPQKKTSKKSAGGKSASKSKHASSLQQQIQTARPNLDGGVSKMRCSREGCGEYADHNKHHLTTDPDYHEFQPPTTTGKSDAQSAAGGS